MYLIKNRMFISVIIISIMLSTSIAENKSKKRDMQNRSIKNNSKVVYELKLIKTYIVRENKYNNKFIDKINNIFIDNNKNFHICDTRNKRLLILNEELILIKEIGRDGEGPGEYRAVSKSIIDNDNNLYIVDNGLKRINIYKDYQFKKYIKYKSFYSDFAVKDSNNIYLSLLSFTVERDLISKININGIVNNSLLAKSEEDEQVHRSGNGGKLFYCNSGYLYYAYAFPYKIIIFKNDKIVNTIINNRKDFIGITNKSRMVEGNHLGSEINSRIKSIFRTKNNLIIECIINGKNSIDIYDKNYKYQNKVNLQAGHELGFVCNNYIYTFNSGYDDFPEIKKWELQSK